MWKKWLAFSGVLGLIVLLDPAPTPAQPRDGKRDFGRGFPGGGYPGAFPGAVPGGSGEKPSMYVVPGGAPGAAPGGFGAPGERPSVYVAPGGGYPGGAPGGFGGRSFGPPGVPPGAPGSFGTPGTPGMPSPYGGRSFGPPGGGSGMPGAYGAPTPGAPGSGFGGPGSSGGGTSRGMDPERGWMFIQRLTQSNGETVDLSKIPAETRPMLKSMAERSGGIALPESGIWTKAQYLEFNAQSEAAKAQFTASGGAGGMDRSRDRGPGGFGGGFGGSGGGWGGDPSGGGWGQGGWDQKPGEKKDAEEERPVAMRYGKLPKDLPGWFDELDGDKDGQVGLYEWRNNSGKEMKEFTEMDLNADGLVTADEYLRFARQRNIDTKIAKYDESGGTERPANWGLGPVAPGAGGDPRGKGGWGQPGAKIGDGNKGDKGSGDKGSGEKGSGDRKSGNPWGRPKN